MYVKKKLVYCYAIIHFLGLCKFIDDLNRNVANIFVNDQVKL